MDVSAEASADAFPEFQEPLDRSQHYTVKHTFCPPGAIPLWVADMDLPLDPTIHAAIKERAGHASFGYTIQPPELWEAVARWLRVEHGWHVRPDELIFTGNLVSATVNALRAYTKPGDAVAVVRPLYTPLQTLVVGSGRRLVSVDAGPGAAVESPLTLDLAALRASLAAERVAALIWCSPHNPSGRVWTRAELRAVATMCKELDVFIISDEIHCDLVLWGLVHTPMALACADVGHTRVLVASSPGKTWNLAGLHCGFVVVQDAVLRAKYRAVVEHAYLHYGSAFATTGMLAAYVHGGPWRTRVCRYIESQVHFVERFLAAHAPELVPARPQASFLVWVDCARLGLDALRGGATSELCRFFLDAGVKLSDGWSFGGEATAQYQRINVACSRAVLAEALARIAAAVAARRAAAP